MRPLALQNLSGDFEVKARVVGDMALLAVDHALGVLVVAQRAAQLSGVAVVRVERELFGLGLGREIFVVVAFHAGLRFGGRRRIGDAVALLAAYRALLVPRKKRAGKNKRFGFHEKLH